MGDSETVPEVPAVTAPAPQFTVTVEQIQGICQMLTDASNNPANFALCGLLHAARQTIAILLQAVKPPEAPKAD